MAEMVSPPVKQQKATYSNTPELPIVFKFTGCLVNYVFSCLRFGNFLL